MELTVTSGYEGGNPQNASNIEPLGDAICVRPESEDGDSNYKFAFDVTLRNESDAPRALKLIVDWQEPPEVGTKYMKPRKSIFVIGADVSREVTGRLDGDQVRQHASLLASPVRAAGA